MEDMEDYDYEDFCREEETFHRASLRAEIARQNGRKGGRPPKGEPRPCHIDVRVSERELSLIKSHAAGFGLSVPDFIRSISVGVKPRSATAEEKQAVETLIGYHTHFRRIGNMYRDRESLSAIGEVVKETAEMIKNWVYDWKREHGKG